MFESLGRLVGGERTPRPIAVGDLPGYKHGYHTGDKWDGGFGVTELLALDYWTLRARSAQMFRSNHYARGLFRRLLTNIINTGLHLEADPLAELLGLDPDALDDWAEEVENRFAVWGSRARTCDHQELKTFGELQRAALLEALVSGDVLVALVQSQVTSLPRVRLISGGNVQTPFPLPKLRSGHTINHGVELDAQGRHVAFYVRQPDHTVKRLPAYGEKSGRKLAWLVYGTDHRHGDVRGEPILGIILQALRDLDRYRDSTLRKAVINSILAMFVTREDDGPPSRAFGAGASRRTTTTVRDTEGEERSLNIAEYVPGLVVDFLNKGEDIKPGTQGGADQAFGEFETAMIQSIGWAFEIPPEILTLAFSNNYSASQAAINEFRMYLDSARMSFGVGFCQPIHESWLISEVLLGHIEAPGLLAAWRDARQWDVLGAWVMADWTGHVKPSTDPFKLVKGLQGALDTGLITFARAARQFDGGKHSRIVRKQKKERELMADAGVPGAAAVAPTDSAEPPNEQGEAPADGDDDNEDTED